MKPRIYLIIENQKRELDARILFSIISAKNNFSAVIGKKDNLYRFSKYLKSGTYFFKGMGEKNLKPIIRIKNEGHKIIGFDEEGLGIANDVVIKERIKNECVDNVNYFLSWGEKNRSKLTNHYPEKQEKFLSSGNMRLDLLKKDYRKFYTKEVEEIKKKVGNFILVATKFSASNAFDFIKKKQMKQSDFYQWETSFQNKIYEHYFSFLDKIGTSYPNLNVIVKPHPVENHETWKKFLKKFKNINLAFGSMSTNSWLLASDVLISTNCHTSLEAFLLDKKSINYVPYRDPRVEEKIFSEVSLNIEKEEVLLNLLIDKNLREKNFERNVINIDFVKKTIGNFDSTLFDNLNKKLRELSLNKSKLKDKYRNITFFYFLKIIKLLRYYKNSYIDSSEEKKKLTMLAKQKLPSLELRTVKERVKMMKENVFANDKISVDEIYPGCYQIEVKKE